MTEATFDRACDAISEVMPRLTRILRSQPSPGARAVGAWTLGEVAAHLSHVIEKDTATINRQPLPDIELRPQAVAALTDEMLSADTERDPVALADRLDALGSTFLTLTPPTGLVSWIGGTPIAASAVACHLLLETLVHGYDVATAADVPWPIDPAHASLAITGCVLPIITTSPQSWIRPGCPPEARARAAISLRGHERFVLNLDGTPSVELPPRDRRADVHVWADAGALLLIMLGRVSPTRALLHGQVLAWGRRPTAVFTLLNNLTPP